MAAYVLLTKASDNPAVSYHAQVHKGQSEIQHQNDWHFARA